jgi:hypothetical protein
MKPAPDTEATNRAIQVVFKGGHIIKYTQQHFLSILHLTAHRFKLLTVYSIIAPLVFTCSPVPIDRSQPSTILPGPFSEGDAVAWDTTLSIIATQLAILQFLNRAILQESHLHAVLPRPHMTTAEKGVLG